MRYVTANQIVRQTDELYEKGLDLGVYCGFNCLKDLYNVKLGSTTYITGIPSHGKTQFHFELLMNLSEFYGWKHAIFSPETGSPKDIIAELSHSYIRKGFDKRFLNRMILKEKYMADAFLSEFFFIIDSGASSVSTSNLMEMCLEIKEKHGLNTFSIDPFNELNHDYTKFGSREDKYLEFTLGEIRRFARDNKLHVFIIAHPRTLRPLDGIYQPPTAFELSGGAAWYAKAESILCIHRPSLESNETRVIIQKAKPKQIGKKGECTIYWDWLTNRYYELTNTSSIRYAQKENKQPLKNINPNTFIDPNEMPF